ncbi:MULTISPECIES: hypothetical protein [unclassified Bradyrhizobium]|uniref:hypothetical protein n=1 Tax=unclassified Bradyrhizobium TaxID=2631580 RepID=UPI0028E9F96A|nr:MULTISPECIES: hypothetical protein [unclassified Bradyrhizobium]
MTAERRGIDPSGRLHNEAERSFLSAAAARGRNYAAASSDADDGQVARQEILYQPQLGPKARKQVAADDSERSGAKNNEAVKVPGRRRYRSSGRKRPAIAKADVASFELVFHQAEIVRLKMLQDAECLHGEPRQLMRHQ